MTYIVICLEYKSKIRKKKQTKQNTMIQNKLQWSWQSVADFQFPSFEHDKVSDVSSSWLIFTHKHIVSHCSEVPKVPHHRTDFPLKCTEKKIIGFSNPWCDNLKLSLPESLNERRTVSREGLPRLKCRAILWWLAALGGHRVTEDASKHYSPLSLMLVIYNSFHRREQ